MLIVNFEIMFPVLSFGMMEDIHGAKKLAEPPAEPMAEPPAEPMTKPPAKKLAKPMTKPPANIFERWGF